MQPQPASGPRSACAQTVRLLRLKKGERRLLLALSEAILGFMGHWDGKYFQSCRQRQGRCKWCPGLTAWRGYVAALVWADSAARWEPFGVELSDRDELALRDQYRAGTRWSLFRPWPVRTVNQRLQVSLRGAHESAELPPPFDFLPLLRSLYQDPDLLLDLPNPLPAETVVRYAQPEAPAEAQAPPEVAPEGPLPRMLDEVNRRFGPGNGKNGVAKGRE